MWTPHSYSHPERAQVRSITISRSRRLSRRPSRSAPPRNFVQARGLRSEEHTSELQSLMRISYAVFCLKKKTNTYTTNTLDNSLVHTQTTVSHRPHACRHLHNT